jgi:hypothetical protein
MLFIETYKVKFTPSLCGEDRGIKLNIKREWAPPLSVLKIRYWPLPDADDPVPDGHIALSS